MIDRKFSAAVKDLFPRLWPIASYSEAAAAQDWVCFQIASQYLEQWTLRIIRMDLYAYNHAPL
jgi:hypothetical protein